MNNSSSNQIPVSRRIGIGFAHGIGVDLDRRSKQKDDIIQKLSLPDNILSERLE